ncbi:F-box protein At3g07870-like [Cynara cardunculus var. scolymus]|uniref:F-box protein At3g07870-like n=1 Tax=Cynara cardunculus var. scolymus TaxID=59895 RepID=UPI000D62FAF6|nr:F-box protein At3g07870-like [Cynara cardunculus var. scolymus]
METMLDQNPLQNIPAIPMSKELPKDVIIDILSRLPVRYILRFKSVSKSWYALFQNPNFIAKHFQNQKANPDVDGLDASFLFSPYKSSFDATSNRNVGLLLSESEKSIKIPIGLDIPFLSISKPLRVCGTVNGLICLSILPIASIILLWNPATRVFKDLPVSTIDRPKSGPIKVVLGYGYDEATNDYKVLRIVYYGYPLNQVEIYSLNTNSWKEIKTRVQFLIFEAACSVFLKGKFHWTAIGFEEMHGKKLIVCFDICREAFSYIMPPGFDFSDCDGESKTSWTVAGMKESLAVIGSSGNGSGKRFEVWVMKEYGVVSSWTKYRSFELQTEVGRTLGCGLKGEFLLEKDNNQLVLYDPDSQSIKNLGNHGVPCWSDVFNHVGSLLPIKGGKIAERTNLSAVVPDIFFVRKMDLSVQ